MRPIYLLLFYGIVIFADVCFKKYSHLNANDRLAVH